MRERFLVRIATDPRIQRIVWRPMTMVFFGDSEMDVDVVYKSAILCDACNAQLYTGRGRRRSARLDTLSLTENTSTRRSARTAANDTTGNYRSTTRWRRLRRDER
jgi:hypothetical protein